MSTSSNIRRMRRTRDGPASTEMASAAANSGGASSSSGGAAVAAGSAGDEGNADSDAAPSVFNIYNLTGDAKAAYGLLVGNDGEGGRNDTSATHKYNAMLLSTLSSVEKSDSSNCCDDMLKRMDQLEKELFQQKQRVTDIKDRGGNSAEQKRWRNELIFAHNRALVFLAQGNYRDAALICIDHLNRSGDDALLLRPRKTKHPADVTTVASRMALLLLECILALSIGRTQGISSVKIEPLVGVDCPTPNDVFEWLDGLDSDKDPQLKFLLNLYKSRFDLADLDEFGKRRDGGIRSARKELKQAMDVYQHKLRPSFGAEASGSVVSSANSADQDTVMSQSVSNDQQHQQQQPPGSVVLQKPNRSALSLKANAEQLKGNSKKGLILLSEISSFPVDGAAADPAYETMHSNNLAVVYETIGKRHLALHALAKGLRTVEGNETSSSTMAGFYEDGTACPDQTLLVLYNAAICSLQAHHFMSAYECMASIVVRSDVFRCNPRCWLRLSEACIGVFSQLQKKASDNDSSKFTAVNIDG